MCGRTACSLAPDDIVRACTFKDKNGKRRRPKWIDSPGGQKYKAGYNLAPGAHTPVLVAANAMRCLHVGLDVDCKGDSQHVVAPMKWGMVPPWHDADPYKVPYETNNCRAEGMMERKTFKIPLLKGRRCVILADGFYEWKSSKAGKQPHYFYFPKTKSEALELNLNEEVISKCEVLNMVSNDNINLAPNKTFLCEDQDKKDLQGYIGMNTKEEKMSENVDKSLSQYGKDCNSFGTQEEDKEQRSDQVYCEKSVSVKCENENPNNVKFDVHNLACVKQELNEQSTDSKLEPSNQCNQNTINTKFEASDSSCQYSQYSGVHGKMTSDKIGPEVTVLVEQTERKQIKTAGVIDDLECDWHGHRLLTMAGVFDIWQPNKSVEPLFSYSVITVSASKDMDWCHHRMPAILSSDEEVEMWLDSSNVPINKAIELIKPKVCLNHHAVSKQVNNSRYQASDCVTPLSEIPKQPVASPSNQLMQRWLSSAKSASATKRRSTESNNDIQNPSPSHTKDSTTGNKKKQAKLNPMMQWLKSGSPPEKNLMKN